MNIYLRTPIKEDKDKYLDYIEEYMNYDNDNKIFTINAKKNYQLWLKLVQLSNMGIKLPNNMVPISLYFLLEDDELIGHASICKNLNKSYIGGHIGYSIRPTKRNQGYGKKLIPLILDKCDSEEVIICCLNNNIESNKIILENNGILDEIVYYNNDVYKNYKVKTRRRL